ncbi:AbrB/MazE/SpoVT family DNA-binding domain-containing protein [Desulfurobacterium atlanticum]|uniref:Antitoxin MazE n=1 Tax=Desulfurobacterium atlanticum TaxID=240169 RepID=A0A238YD94_9BACT|nr:AbrB/MazE/SpoVT family DNA-binding domain-containing protein [Desulfurobacterium atlanticum]SNR69030.1 antitoxin MazE [Desulfurobacterium atlanticum]
MLTKVQKWGNSLAVRIPSAFAKEIGLCPDTEVELKLEDNKLVIIPNKRRQLEELLKQVTPENLHSEIDWGEKSGEEEW